MPPQSHADRRGNDTAPPESGRGASFCVSDETWRLSSESSENVMLDPDGVLASLRTEIQKIATAPLGKTKPLPRFQHDHLPEAE